MALLNYDVRFGSQADMTVSICDVRFTPESGRRFSALGCRLSANRRHRAATAPIPSSQDVTYEMAAVIAAVR